MALNRPDRSQVGLDASSEGVLAKGRGDGFDHFVARVLGRNVSRHAASMEAIFEIWQSSQVDGTFLDHLVGRGVLDRLGARSLFLAWQGRLDGRDTQILADPEAIGQALSRLLLGDSPRAIRRRESARAIGSKLGAYTIKGVLGWGGSGPVYLGIHPSLRIPVALKPISSANGRAGALFRDRLRVEARLQATVRHPNVVRVVDFDDDSEPFLVFEYVHGEDLGCRLRAGPLSTPEAFTLLMHATLGLRAAHRVGVVHADVKPANLLFTPESGFKLTDFGLARSRRAFARVVPAASPPSERSARGSLNYMAPEQFENNHDHRSDIYSLGLTVHHALTGQMPVAGIDPAVVMLRHKRGEVAPLHHVCPGVRREVSDLVGKMVAVDPDRRVNDYDELLRAAEAAFGSRLDPY